MNYLYSTVNQIRDKYTPVSHTSTFRKTGQITPEEFVAAGDYLVFKFPTWQWAGADNESKRATHLPADKQYLVTRGVPCLRRATSLAYTDADEDAERLLSFGDSTGADEWVETHAGRKIGADAANPGAIDDIPDLGEGVSLYGLQDGDALEISLMDVVIAVIAHA